jgi:hypothetical protein
MQPQPGVLCSSLPFDAHSLLQKYSHPSPPPHSPARPPPHPTPHSPGWQPYWRAPLMAVVVILSVAMSVMLFAALVLGHRHIMFLEAMLPKQVVGEERGGRGCAGKGVCMMSGRGAGRKIVVSAAQCGNAELTQ